MKFFAKQKVDQIGITAVTLQKILLFLMVCLLFVIAVIHILKQC